MLITERPRGIPLKAPYKGWPVCSYPLQSGPQELPQQPFLSALWPHSCKESLMGLDRPSSQFNLTHRDCWLPPSCPSQLTQSSLTPKQCKAQLSQTCPPPAKPRKSLDMDVAPYPGQGLGCGHSLNICPTRTRAKENRERKCPQDRRKPRP